MNMFIRQQKLYIWIHLCVCVNEIKAHNYYVRFMEQMKIKVKKIFEKIKSLYMIWMGCHGIQAFFL